MNKLYKSLALFLALFSVTAVNAQNPEDFIELDDFNADLMEELVMERVNEYRLSNGLDIVIKADEMEEAAQGQAEDFMELMRVDYNDDAGKRLEKAGGTANVEYVGAYATAAKSKEQYTYVEVADELFGKLTKSKKNQKILEKADMFYTGIGVALDPDKRRVYYTQMMGGVSALNSGADKQLRKELPHKYVKGKKGLSPYVMTACKNTEKWTQYQKLYEGLSIEGKYVYLEYDNMKELKKLLRKDTDGLGVDLIMQEQYPCDGPNIYDNTRIGKGLLAKPYTLKKMEKKNEVEGDRPSSFYGPIGKLKGKWVKEMPEDFEINLMIIQDKTVCKVIKQTYQEDGGIESLTLISLYPDTSETTAAGWKPENQKAELTFKVPFKVNETQFKKDDIKGLIDALNEPRHTIDEINIEAHSSLEGDTAKNRTLQEKRAASIIAAIEQIYGNETGELLEKGTITTTNGWEIFQEQIKGNEAYAKYQDKTFEEVKDMMKEPGAIKEMDTLLAAQRYAGIEMKVTYDVSGPYEKPFVINQMQKAIADKNGAQALKVQKFAMRRIFEGAYDALEFASMEVPMEEQFASLKINQLFLQNQMDNNGKLSEELIPAINEIYEMAPENAFAAFNKYMLDVKFGEIADRKEIKGMQQNINDLYGKAVPDKWVDALNLEYQFKVIAMVRADTLEMDDTEEIVEGSLDRIKKIFNVEGSSWQNALKLGYIFINYNDMAYATEIMAPFIEEEGVDPELYYAYISAAVHDDALIYTPAFRAAMTGAKDADQERYCKLFGGDFHSIQLLDHPLIKEEYCATCK